MMSPLQVGHEESNWAADVGARFDCLSTVKNVKVRHTHQGWTEGPQAESDGAEVMEQCF